jgi:O-antigen ligase
VAFSFALWTWRRAGWGQRTATLVLAAALVSNLAPYAPAPQRTRLATIPHEMTRGTLHDRTRIWKAGLKAFRAHKRTLAVGVGAGAYPAAVRPWLGVPDLPGFQYVAHNTFLSVLVETGAFGFLLYGGLLAVLAGFVWIMPRPERALWAVALAVWATGVTTLTWEHYKPGWLIMSLIATAWARSYWHAEPS